MAIKYYEKYPQRWESPSQDYPQGAFKNLSALGEQDGSYLEKDWLNDQAGFFGALLRNAEMTPNGLVDTAQRSQFYDALIKVAKESVDLSAYRKKDDLLFKGSIDLQDTDGTVRGQVVATDQGLQLTQYPKDGGLQTFTFPSVGGEVLTDGKGKWAMPEEGGELALRGDLENWKATIDKPSVGQVGLGNFNEPTYMLEMESGGAQQSVCFDTVNRHIYTSHTARLNGQVINRFDMDTGVHTPLTHVGLQDKRLGHSGLGITYSEDGSPVLWTSLNKDYSEGRASIVSFKPKMEARTDNVDSIDATPNHFEFTEYTLFKGAWRNLNPTISKCERYVTVFHSNLPSTNIHTFRTWAIKDLVAGGDNTQNYLYSFEVPHYTADSKGINFQGMANDGKYVYIVGGGYHADYENHKDEPTFRFHIYTLDGELVYYNLNVKLGLKDMLKPPLTGDAIREVEGIAFLGDALHVLIAGSRSPTGRRQYLYELSSNTVLRSKLGLDTTTLKGADVYRAKVSNKITYSFVDINYLPEDGTYLTDNALRVQGERMLSLATRFDRNINGKPYGRLIISTVDADGNFDRRWALLGSGDFVPANNGQVSIGEKKGTLRDLYLTNQPTVTSDAKAKFDIEDIDEKYMRVMSRLKFKQFKLKAGTSGRTHFGIVAQDWIKACNEAGVDPYESGVLVGSEKEGYAIRYGELQNLFNAYILSKLK